MRDGRDGLYGIFEYNTDLFDQAMLEQLSRHFQTVLEALVREPSQPLSSIPLLGAEEKEQLLVGWNETSVAYPDQVCVHDLFAAQVARTPDAVALVTADRRFSYQELDRCANQLAHHLQGMGVGPGALVGICLERSLEMVVAILATLKAGGAFVPMDPAYPQDRLAYMLADAGAAVVLSQVSVLAALPEHGAQVLCLDRDWPLIANASTTTPVSAVTPTDLAYVIYTSGSTGTPKGVSRPARLFTLPTMRRAWIRPG
jgi:non-ribosomal peptide synthetase component F